MAVVEGFEPSDGGYPSHAFEACSGVLYNRLVLACLDRVKALPRPSGVAKAAAIGALIGLLTFVDPLATGGGDTLTQSILSGTDTALPVIAGLLAMRFVAGPISYAASPGDQAGLTIPMALVGMAAFFDAAVRAPVTATAARCLWRNCSGARGSMTACGNECRGARRHEWGTNSVPVVRH